MTSCSNTSRSWRRPAPPTFRRAAASATCIARPSARKQRRISVRPGRGRAMPRSYPKKPAR
jgi:hypothetical protein